MIDLGNVHATSFLPIVKNCPLFGLASMKYVNDE